MRRIALIFVFLTLLSFHFSVFSQDDRDGRSLVVLEEQIIPEMNVVNNKLTLKNAPVGKRVEIISIIGIKIKEIRITSSDMEQELNLRSGVYIFEMEGTVKKYIIR